MSVTSAYSDLGPDVIRTSPFVSPILNEGGSELNLRTVRRGFGKAPADMISRSPLWDEQWLIGGGYPVGSVSMLCPASSVFPRAPCLPAPWDDALQNGGHTRSAPPRLHHEPPRVVGALS
jgi:hypothetical protein